MAFFNSAVDVLQTLVVALGAGLGIWGVIIFIKTDQTWIGENILHKICCILLIWIALDMLRLPWSDLGFSKKGLFAGLKYGLALGIITFFLSYVAEFIVLFVMGKHSSLRFYITNFSLTQSHTNGSSLLAVIVCVFGNIINVYKRGCLEGCFVKSAYNTILKRQLI